MKAAYALAVVAVVVASVIAIGPVATTASADGQMQGQTTGIDEVTVTNATVTNLTTSLTVDDVEMNLSSPDANTTVNVSLSDARMDVHNGSMTLGHAAVSNDSATIENATVWIENATISVGSATVEVDGMTTTLDNETVSIENRTVTVDNRTISLENRSTDDISDLQDDREAQLTGTERVALQRIAEDLVLHSMTIDGVSAAASLDFASAESIDWDDHEAIGFVDDATSRLDNASAGVENATIEEESLTIDNVSAEVASGNASVDDIFLDVDFERRAIQNRTVELDERSAQFRNVMLSMEDLMDRFGDLTTEN